MKKIKNQIQKINIEIYIFALLLLTTLAFFTNYYVYQMHNIKQGVNIFDNIFDTELGWLLFVIIFSGYIIAIIFSLIDQRFSKRARISFYLTALLSTVTFVGLLIWTQNNDDFVFSNTEVLGVIIRGRYGFAVYIIGIYLLFLALISYFYYKKAN